MPTTTLSDLSQLAKLDEDKAIAIICSIDYDAIPKHETMPLSQIIPTSMWQNLTQGQKGFVGKVFYQHHKALQFKCDGKRTSKTTYVYRLVTDFKQ